MIRYGMVVELDKTQISEQQILYDAEFEVGYAIGRLLRLTNNNVQYVSEACKEGIRLASKALNLQNN